MLLLPVVDWPTVEQGKEGKDCRQSQPPSIHFYSTLLLTSSPARQWCLGNHGVVDGLSAWIVDAGETIVLTAWTVGVCI